MNALASRFSDIAAVGARLRHFAPELSLFALKGDLSFPRIPAALDSRMTLEAFENVVYMGHQPVALSGAKLGASACAGANAAAQMSAASTPPAAENYPNFHVQKRPRRPPQLAIEPVVAASSIHALIASILSHLDDADGSPLG
jgi:hypothetical protein